MANATKKKRPRFYTPTCISHWPWLMTPDTKFDEAGVYKVDLEMSDAQVTELQKQLVQEVADQEADLRKTDPKKMGKWKIVWPVKDQNDNDGNPTGMKLVSFSQKAKVVIAGKPDLVFTVQCFDSKKNPVSPTLKLGSGTEMKLCFQVRVVPDNLSKCIRVKLHPLAAQLIKVVEYSGGSDFGFAEEAGFEAVPVSEATEPAKGPQPSDNPDF